MWLKGKTVWGGWGGSKGTLQPTSRHTGKMLDWRLVTQPLPVRTFTVSHTCVPVVW